MATLYTQADTNVRKTWFLMLTFFIVVVGVAWGFSYAFGNPAILWVAVAVAVLMNIGSYWYSDKLVIATSGAKQITRDQYPDFWNITENLAITAGIPMPKLYIINDPAPNAFATGRDPEHAAVAATTGLLGMMDRSELEGVIAHELSHVKNRDILVMTVVVVLLGFITLLSDFFLRMSLYGGRGNSEGDGRVRLIGMAIGLALAIFAPIIAQLIQLAISRKREFLADASGALLTRYPEGLASALRKIGSYSMPMKRANNATAHLFIGNPFGAKAKGFVSKLFATHPPIEERINALLGRS